MPFIGGAQIPREVDVGKTDRRGDVILFVSLLAATLDPAVTGRPGAAATLDDVTGRQVHGRTVDTGTDETGVRFLPSTDQGRKWI